MKTLSADTTPEAEAVLIDLVRRAPVWKRLQVVDQMYETLRQLALTDIQRRHPDANVQEINRRLAARVLTRTDMINAYQWDPEIEGY